MTNAYEHFKLAIYCTATCLDASFEQIQRELIFFRNHLKVSKVYLENHRGDVSLSKERLLELKAFFEERGIETAGGITPILGKRYRPGYGRHLQAICYTDEASRKDFQAAVETAAAVFDEVIFDDFFFTNCACDDCLQAKGDRSWEEFRLELMAEVSENLIRKPALAVNPRVKLVIKYPNWNESYQSSGYNTEKQPLIFDGVYTGTETRDPAITQQHIPRYASYSLLRWMENLAPGKNGGGWFDSFDCTYTEYYLEQAYLTLFAKAKEMTLFCYSILKESYYIPALGHQLDKLDALIGQLGNPVGMKVYEPHHAKGEDHLYDYLGMMGIPLELTPTFPKDGSPLLITANAAKDETVLAKMKAHLRGGGTIIMTSGFLTRMAGKGVEDLTVLRATGRSMAASLFAQDTGVCSFNHFSSSGEAVTLPVLDFSTNSTWQKLVAWNGQMNIPLLVYDYYGNGKLYTLAVPDNYADLWKLPEAAVSGIRNVFTEEVLPFELVGPAEVGLFAYDNGTFIVESFSKVPQTWHITGLKRKRLTVLAKMPGTQVAVIPHEDASGYTLHMPPSSVCVLRLSE
ncbi:hypothetical protein [Gorillibacterium massiliense]|uniref:hypothetical protein n=1 Tax=Gorillibacterium massiliense TaxID=1280390 RepID=UPI0004B91AC2|nr:hypothetical protein [Gorillibacterium massiliense]